MVKLTNSGNYTLLGGRELRTALVTEKGDTQGTQGTPQPRPRSRRILKGANPTICESHHTLSVLIFASLNFRGNKISRELIREIREKHAKSAKFNSREIRKKIGIREIREI